MLSHATAVIIGGLALTVSGCGQSDFSVLTYNVAGLPEGYSASHPAQNIPQMSALLNTYSVVLVQEDFAYHTELAAEALHEFQLPRTPESEAELAESGKITNKSGLARFSEFAIDRVAQQRWRACNGIVDHQNDCLAPKGFSVAEHLIELEHTTVAIDIYNLHLDAGRSSEDQLARETQVTQLLEMLQKRSRFKAVMVAGDTNLGKEDRALLQRLLSEAGLTDTCSELGCADPDRIDRILYRSSDWVHLVPIRWYIPGEFVDAAGKPLSDHEPVAVDFTIGVYPSYLSPEQLPPYAESEQSADWEQTELDPEPPLTTGMAP